MKTVVDSNDSSDKWTFSDGFEVELAGTSALVVGGEVNSLLTKSKIECGDSSLVPLWFNELASSESLTCSKIGSAEIDSFIFSDNRNKLSKFYVFLHVK